jgi:hypothetical protein
MQCEKCRLPLWKAGEIVPAGTYARVDDQSYKVVRLDQEGRCQQRVMAISRGTVLLPGPAHVWGAPIKRWRPPVRAIGVRKALPLPFP